MGDVEAADRQMQQCRLDPRPGDVGGDDLVGPPSGAKAWAGTSSRPVCRTLTPMPVIHLLPEALGPRVDAAVEFVTLG
jgi:hypothetical protein